MNLNNRGWGIREMLFLSSILIFFFCLAIYFIYVLYSSFDLSVNNNDIIEHNDEVYKTYEQLIKDAAYDYLNSVNYEFSDRIINMSTLINAGLMSDLYDPETDNKCNGYIKVIDLEDKQIDAYIKCDNYVTEGY